MDGMSQEMETILAAKAARRRVLARLPIEEKVKILIELQKMTAPILRAKGRTVHVWELTDSTRD